MFNVFYTKFIYLCIYDLFHLLLSFMTHLWIRMDVCIYIYIYIYIYTPVSTYVCVCVCMYIYIFLNRAVIVTDRNGGWQQ